MKKWQIAALVMVAAVVTYYAVGLFMTDRQRVSRLVHRLATRLEKRDGPGFCSLLAEDYHDTYPHGSRAGIRVLLAVVMPQLRSISVRIEDLRVDVAGEKGTAVCVIRLAALPAAREAEPQPWVSQVKLHVKKVNGEWLVGEAEYQYPGPLRLLD